MLVPINSSLFIDNQIIIRNHNLILIPKSCGSLVNAHCLFHHPLSTPMSSSVPLTPKPVRTRASRTNTPRSVRKKTILTNDFDQSYLEEDDETYVYNNSASDGSASEDEGSDLDDISEASLDDNSTDVASDLNEKTVGKEKDAKTVDPTVEGAESSKLRQFIIKHEIVRKGLHSSFGFITLFFYTVGASHTLFVMPIALLFVLLLANDYIRFQNPELNKKIVKQFHYLIREREVDHYNGTIYYTAGLIMVFSVLPKDISVMAVLLLSWADTAASTFGRKYGKYTFQIAKGKSFAGALASFITGVCSCYLLYGYIIPRYTATVDSPTDIFWKPEQSVLNFHVYAMICGLVASFSECIDFFGLDDNLTIPVISGYLLYGLVRWFHL